MPMILTVHQFSYLLSELFKKLKVNLLSVHVFSSSLQLFHKFTPLTIHYLVYYFYLVTEFISFLFLRFHIYYLVFHCR